VQASKAAGICGGGITGRKTSELIVSVMPSVLWTLEFNPAAAVIHQRDMRADQPPNGSASPLKMQKKCLSRVCIAKFELSLYHARRSMRTACVMYPFY
jgi:hypothetical protein